MGVHTNTHTPHFRETQGRSGLMSQKREKLRAAEGHGDLFEPKLGLGHGVYHSNRNPTKTMSVDIIGFLWSLLGAESFLQSYWRFGGNYDNDRYEFPLSEKPCLCAQVLKPRDQESDCSDLHRAACLPGDARSLLVSSPFLCSPPPSSSLRNTLTFPRLLISRAS